MEENDAQKSLKRIFLALFVLFLPLFAVAQSGDEVTDLLVKMGFENVSWGENEQERVYLLENSAYRLSGVGIGKALDEIQKCGMPGNGKGCRLIVLDNNVPQVSLYCNASVEDGRELSRNDWDVSYDLGESWEIVKGKKRKNSSLYKVDVLVYPEFSFKNGRLSIPYQVNLNMSPAVQVSLWRGGKATAQLVIPLANNYGYQYDDVRPGYITLSQTVRLPYNIFLTGTVGIFDNHRAGADLRAKAFLSNGNFWIDGRISYTVSGIWGEWAYVKGKYKNIHPFRYIYDKEESQITAHLGVNYYWERFDTQMAFRGETFINGDAGFRFDMIRHFKYCSIGFWGSYIPSDWWNDGLNGGFQFQITLPPYKYKRSGYVPRVMPSRNWGFRYNAGGTYVYGERFTADIEENINNDIKYNPNYIKTELLNF